MLAFFRRRNWGQSILSRIRLPVLLFAVIAGYLAMIGMFAWIYAGHVVASSTGSDASLSERLYFSGITQATVGYGDFTPKDAFGRRASVGQALLGTLWISLSTAIIIARFLLPHPRGITLPSAFVFNPIRHRCEIPVISASVGTISRIEASLHWTGQPAPQPPRLDVSSIPYSLKFGQGSLVTSPEVPLRRTVRGRWVPQEDVSPQPRDFEQDRGLILDVQFTSPFMVTMFVSQQFEWDDVTCGVYVGLKSQLLATDKDPEMRLHCTSQCHFRPSCRLRNKVP